MRNLTRKAMDYITNLFPCITFELATTSSPNFVTINPGSECGSELGMRGGEQVMLESVFLFGQIKINVR